MITSYKPCFVPQYCKRLFISYFGGNHLSTGANTPVLLLVHFQERKLPYQNLGFSLVGFTSFHPPRFREGSVTVALLQVFMPYPHGDLGIFPAVSKRTCCPGLFFRQARTLRASQPVRAWTFLYSRRLQRLPERHSQQYLL